jgi:hypothetical protein
LKEEFAKWFKTEGYNIAKLNPKAEESADRPPPTMSRDGILEDSHFVCTM